MIPSSLNLFIPNDAYIVNQLYDTTESWFLYQMVAQFTMRTYGVKQGFRFVEGIWLHRKSSQIRFFFGKDLFFIILAQREMSNHLI